MSDLVERPSSIGEAWRKLIQQQAEIERLEGDLQVTRLQRDARMVSEFVVDDAVKADIERLCNIVTTQEDALKEFHAEIERLTVRNKNQCERLDQQIKHNADLINRNAKLQAVVDAAKDYVWVLDHGKTTEAMNCCLQDLRKKVATLEGNDERLRTTR